MTFSATSWLNWEEVPPFTPMVELWRVWARHAEREREREKWGVSVGGGREGGLQAWEWRKGQSRRGRMPAGWVPAQAPGPGPAVRAEGRSWALSQCERCTSGPTRGRKLDLRAVLKLRTLGGTQTDGSEAQGSGRLAKTPRNYYKTIVIKIVKCWSWNYRL